MISRSFYIKDNMFKQYLERNVKHYSIKDPSVTLEWYEYVLIEGDTLPKITKKLFGNNMEYLWTLIADNNPLRHPDDWRAGDIIKLPRIIIRDSDTIRQTFKE